MAAPDVRVNSRRVPRVVMGFMVVVTALVVGISATGLWMRGVVFRESRWKQTIAPLGSDDEVQAALAAWAGTEIRQVIDVKPYLEDILPSGAQGLASPLSFAIEGFIAERAASFFESDQFSELWERSTVRLHSAVLKVLRGDSEAVSVRDGQVVLNLVPILNQVLASISDELSQLLNRDINLPQIDPNTPASEAIERLSSALGRELPDDFGQIVVFDSDQLTEVQTTLRWFNSGAIVLGIVAVLLIAATLLVSPHRRRTVISLGVSIAVVTALLRRTTFISQKQVVEEVKPQNQAAANAVFDQVLSFYRAVTLWMLAICAVAVFVAWLVGPSRAAVAIRGGVSRTGHRTADAAGDVSWLHTYASAARYGVLIVAGLIVLFGSFTFLSLVLFGLVIAAIVIWLTWVGQSHDGDAPGTKSPDLTTEGRA
ncbi:MAG TPA: hypothetical protein VFX21_03310 [Acidimicrobiia bacterium]|nr:hypothetical protein [Acidimicrobiia bacterium]